MRHPSLWLALWSSLARLDVSPPLVLLIQRDGAGAPAKAVSLMDESLAVTSELGMRPLM